MNWLCGGGMAFAALLCAIDIPKAEDVWVVV